jgi:hypothetical protein
LEQERIRKEAEIRVKEIDLHIEMQKLVADRQTIKAIVKEIADLQTDSTRRGWCDVRCLWSSHPRLTQEGPQDDEEMEGREGRMEEFVAPITYHASLYPCITEF